MLRIPVISLVAILVLCSVSESAEVKTFSPTGTVRTIRQVRAEFSEAVVPVGQPLAAQPFDIECSEKGSGRWIDSQNWIYDFNRDLPTDVTCTFTLRKNLKALTGAVITGSREFSFKTGSPTIIETSPYEGDSNIAEDQMFFLEFDGDVPAAEIVNGVSLAVSGIENRIPVELVSANDLKTLLQDSSFKRYASKIGKSVFVIRAQTRFPNEAKIRLQWNKEARIFEYQVRPVFRAEMSCERENANAACNPITAPSVRFKSEISSRDAKLIRMKTPEGKYLLGEGVEKLRESDSVSAVTFPKPLSALASYTIELPAGLKDTEGRALTNAANFPLTFKTSAYPPLVKFAARFGVVELASPVLPVTVRAVEASLKFAQAEVRTLKVNASGIQGEKEFLDWAREAISGDWDSSSNKSIFADRKAASPVERKTLPKPGGAQEFEVMGIPLKGAGLHIVEIESAALGQSLIGNRPMFVASAVLVTDLAVHLKYSHARSLVWVTKLSTGQPVANADVAVYTCSGTRLVSGKSDQNGLFMIEKLSVPAQSSDSNCGKLIATATLGSDRSFVVDNWDNGIEPYRFNVPYNYDEKPNNQRVQPILARSLLRAGETLNMKHVARLTTPQGFSFPSKQDLPGAVALQHAGSDELYKFELKFDASMSAVTDWKIPKGAKLGIYKISYLKALKDKPDWSIDVADTFRVEEFKVPFLKGTIEAAGAPFVRPKAIETNLSLSYLSGGAASGETVQVRSQFSERSSVSFTDYDDYTFATARLTEGVRRSSEDESDDAESSGYAAKRNDVQSQSVKLDTAGAARLELKVPKAADNRPGRLEVEMEYRDPNGNVETASNSFETWNSDLLVGLKPSAWATTTESVKMSAVVVDIRGRPHRNIRVRIEQFSRQYYSYRKKLVGGFFGYESASEIKKAGVFCEGVTDDKGLLACDKPVKADGELFFQAAIKDSKGSESYASRSVYVYAKDRMWFDMSDDDRMDVISDVKQFEAGQTAKYQVRMPFKKATALVTVEREGILDAYVVPVSGEKPEVSVPVKANYSPNAYVSVLAVRGRADEFKPTALADFGKPSFKLGIGKMKVGWSSHELKVRTETDKPVYQTREKARLKIRVTAPGSANVPAKGSEVAVAVVDQALLELMPNTTWDVLSSMMKERSYDVKTSTLQTNVIGKRHFGKKALAAGGGGGRSATRELFDTLVLWKAKVALDENGEATLEVPLNDSISKFRIAVVATSGADLFGKGEASFSTTKDLQVIAGLPLSLRESDTFNFEATVRNTTSELLQTQVDLDFGGVKLPPKQVSLKAGSSQVVGWTVTVPNSVAELKLTLRASAGARSDAITKSVPVLPAVPVTTLQATLAQVSPTYKVAVEYPKEALANQGEVIVNLKAKLGDSLDPVRHAMSGLEWTCFEQRLSRAVVLDDRKAWKELSDSIPSYLDGNGLLKYWPDMPEGSDVLTAYAIAITHEAGWTIPPGPLSKMRQGLKSFVEGKLKLSDRYLQTRYLQARKLTALEALSRHGQDASSLVSLIQVTPQTWSTASVLDWWAILRRWPSVPSRAKRQAEMTQVLRSRLDFRGTRLGFSTEKDDFFSWGMGSPDLNAARLMLGALTDAEWKPEAPRLVRGVMDRRKLGVWFNTTANAWNVVAMTKFAREFEKAPITGKTNVTMGSQKKTLDWSKSASGGSLALRRPSSREELSLQHAGTGSPWLTLEVRAAVPLKSPVSNGFKVKRELIGVQRKSPNVWSRGDVVRVKLSFDAQTDSSWVVVQDPVPAGASILGTGLGRDSRLSVSGEKSTGAWLAFQESAADSYRGYFDYVSKGASTIEYTMRLNQSGKFVLPPTRIQAMYAPDILGETPNAVFEIKE